MIAEAGGFVSANIHSPITGDVTAVDLQLNGQGVQQMAITIKRTGDDESNTKMAEFIACINHSFFSLPLT